MEITVSKSLRIKALLGFNDSKKESIWINFFVKSKSIRVRIPSGDYKLPIAKENPELLQLIESAIEKWINARVTKMIPHPNDVRKIIKEVVKRFLLETEVSVN